MQADAEGSTRSREVGYEGRSCVLVVDDDEQVRTLHSRLLKSLGYRVETAADGVEALAKLALGIDLVLLDGQMPNMDGFEVASHIRAREAEHGGFLPIVMVSGLTGRSQHRRALEVGINDFVSKPIDGDELHLRIHWLLDLKRAHDRLNERSVSLERSVETRTMALRNALEQMSDARREIYDAHLDTIRRLTIAAEFKDQDTGDHIVRIGHYARVVAEALGTAPGFVETITHAAPLHDVGKLGIPDAILLKPGRLDEEELRVMRTHALLGAALLSDSKSKVIQMGKRIAEAHHERWDGRGYPHGIAGDDIPLEARICAVVDVFDALTMDRPYRGALPTDEVLVMMQAEAGAHFDPRVLSVFLANLDQIQEIRSSYVSRGNASDRAPSSPSDVIRSGLERHAVRSWPPGTLNRLRDVSGL